MAASLDSIRAAHPEWGVVQIATAPNGGIWAVGRDGGVFALDSEGGTTGTRAPINIDRPFSYTGLDPTQRQGDRTFTGISATGSGYTLTSSRGEFYTFDAPKPQVPVTNAVPAAPDPNSPAAQSAKGLLASTLAAVGLPATLADTLWDDNYLRQGRPVQTIIDVDIPASDAFRAKFPAFDQFRAQTGGTVKDYIAQTNTYAGALKAAGLPASFYDSPDDFAKWINGGVSPKEVSDRIMLAKEAAITAPPAVHDYLINQEGLDANNLAAFFLDQDKGDLVKQQALMTRGEIAGAGKAAGFGTLTKAEASGIQEQGTTGALAGQRFGELTPLAQGLFAGRNVEEAETGGGVGRKEALGYVAGQGADEAAIAAARAKRAARFTGGGGAASGGQGEQGIR